MSKSDDSTYGIGAVAGLTGLSTQVIRAWERRYEAVVASRSSNGRRVYTNRHVDKLLMLKALTERGTPISAVANLSLDDLRARVAEMDQISARPLTGNVKVAVLGAFLPEILSSKQLAGYPLEMLVSGADPRRLLTDLRRCKVDVLAVEMTHLNRASIELIEQLTRNCQVNKVVVAYGFARRKDEQALLESGVRLIKTPVSGDELAMAIITAFGQPQEKAETRPSRAGSRQASQPEAAAPARRYSEHQLAQLAQIESEVDCECPRQVAEILKTLTAFEIYSAECEDQNEQDAELHAYLHLATAQSRAVMEKALDRLIEVEQIEI